MKNITIEKHSDHLNIADSTWQKALENVEADPVVQIKHAALDGAEKYRAHVAEIPEKVGCHYHGKGDEHYKIVAGRGRLHWGKVNSADDIEWGEPINVVTGDSFTVPEGYAHQLQRIGEENLVILFGCPDAHLNDDLDRFMLPDAPTLKHSIAKGPTGPSR